MCVHIEILCKMQNIIIWYDYNLKTRRVAQVLLFFIVYKNESYQDLTGTYYTLKETPVVVPPLKNGANWVIQSTDVIQFRITRVKNEVAINILVNCYICINCVVFMVYRGIYEKFGKSQNRKMNLHRCIIICVCAQWDADVSQNQYILTNANDI